MNTQHATESNVGTFGGHDYREHDVNDNGSSIPGLVSFLGSLQEPVFEFDEIGNFHYANPAFIDLIGGLPPRRLRAIKLGSTCTTTPYFLSEDDDDQWASFVQAHARVAFPNQTVRPFSFSVLRLDGIRVKCDFTGQRLLSRNGILLAMVALVKPCAHATKTWPSIIEVTDIWTELNRLIFVVDELVHNRDTPVKVPNRTEVVDHPSAHKSEGANWNSAETIQLNLATERRVATLSDRERSIVDGFLHGKRTATIAKEFYLSEHTVRNHLKNIYRKVGVHSLGELRECLMPVAGLLAKKTDQRIIDQ